VSTSPPIPAAFDTARLRRNRGSGVLALLLALCLAWAAWLHFTHTHGDAQQAGHDSRSICGLCVSFDRGIAPPPQPLQIAAAVRPNQLAPSPAITPALESRSERPRARGPPLHSA
jgi:hypothetical protein